MEEQLYVAKTHPPTNTHTHTHTSTPARTRTSEQQMFTGTQHHNNTAVLLTMVNGW